jgi:hypothetical protein
MYIPCEVPGPLSFEFDKSFIEIARWSVYLINAGLISRELIIGLISDCIRTKSILLASLLLCFLFHVNCFKFGFHLWTNKLLKIK